MRFPDARILIMAKAPVPGEVKTRLIPALGPDRAAGLHRRLLGETVARLTAAALAPVELWCAPDATDAAFCGLAATHGCSLHCQTGADLGERMRGGAAEALTRASRVVLVGSDCPLLDAGYVRAALAALDGRDAVLGPAEDGGYVLLGLRRAAADLFDDVPWGGERVAAVTRERMRRLRWDWAELPSLRDLDRPEDLPRYEALTRGAG